MKKLQTRLLTNFIPLIAVPMILISAVSVWLSTGMLVDSFKQRLKDDLRGAELAVNFEQEKLINRANALASEPPFIRSVRKRDNQALLGMLERSMSAFGTDRASVTDKSGLIIASARYPARYIDFGGDPGFVKAVRGQRVVGFEKTEAGLCINVQVPIQDKREIIGVLELSNVFDYNFISEIKAKYGMDVMVVSGDQLQTTTLQNPKAIHDVLEDLVYGQRRLKKGWIFGDTALGGERYYLTSKPVGAGQKPLGQLLFALPSGYIHSQIELLIGLQAAILGIFLLVTVHVSRLISRKIVRPVSALASMAQEISRGNLTGRVAVSGDDEIGQLEALFNKMAADLNLTTISKNYMDTVIRSLIDTLVILSTEGNIIQANRAACSLLAYKENELLGIHFEKLIGEADASIIKKVLSGESVDHAGISYKTKDNKNVPVLFSASPMHNSEGKLIGVVCAAADFTDLKRAELALRKSEEFVWSILNSVDEGFIVLDRQYRILTANRAYCRQTGISPGELKGRTCFDLTHRTGRPCYEHGEDCAVKQVFETGMPYSSVHRHKSADGQIEFVETKAFPLKDDSGQVTSAIEVLVDITEKHLLQEERLKTQKLEAIGTLAGGIAHDFNNLLQGVFGYISLAQLVDDRQRSLKSLEQAEKALRQAVGLTNQLLTFSRGGQPVKEHTAIHPILENAARFSLSGSCSVFSITTENGLWPVDGDAGQIGQVIQNIILNADQAMPVGGRIEIRARNIRADDPALPMMLEKKNYVLIEVLDNGPGIPEQFISRIFDPYFTTKDNGNGLGLATSYSIIKNHGGLIEVRSAAGTGTVFSIYLPGADGQKDEPVWRDAAQTSQRRGRILVMDDEEMIRNLIEEMLHTLGHDVELAENGVDTLEKYRNALAEKTPFDIVILDLTVRGGMGGAETISKLIEIDPGVKAIMSSGYSNDALASNYHSAGFKAFLKKPYIISDLKNELDSLLS